MIYVFIIIVLLVVIAQIQIYSTKEKIRNDSKALGGIRNSYPFVVEFLESQQMTLVFDTGIDFSYQKKYDFEGAFLGTLTIGLKIEGHGREILYSNYTNPAKVKLDGLSVSTSDFSSINKVEAIVERSTEKLIRLIDNEIEKITYVPKITDVSFNEWDVILDSLITSRLKDLINLVIIPYNISLTKFLENMDILDNTWKALQDINYGTPSIRGIYFLPPSFRKDFVAAFPDVYQIFQIECDLGTNKFMNRIKDSRLYSKPEQYYDDDGLTAVAMKEIIDNYFEKYQKLELQL